jgi:transcriptional regulator with XRE-family HTH domain
MTLSQGKNDPLGIGEKVRHFRDQFKPKLKQEKLGELAFGKKTGSQALIKRIENGTQEVKASELKAIAYVLTVRIEDFFIETIDSRLIGRLPFSRPKDYHSHNTP